MQGKDLKINLFSESHSEISAAKCGAFYIDFAADHFVSATKSMLLYTILAKNELEYRSNQFFHPQLTQ